MLIYNNDNNRFSNDKMKVYKEQDKWIIQYIIQYGTISEKKYNFIFDPNIIQFAPDMAHLGLGGYGLFLFWGSESSGDKCGVTSALQRNGMIDMNHIGTFFICTDKTTHFCTRVGNLEYDESVGEVINASLYEGSRKIGDVLSEHIPEAKAYVQRHHAKRKLLGHINTNDSLAMLEAQLDLLTKAYLSRFADSLSEDEKSLGNAIQGNAVTDLHSAEKINNTIMRQKAHIRDEQRIYFANRGDIQNGDPSS